MTTDAMSAQKIAGALAPHIVLVDINLRRSSGLDLILTLTKIDPAILCIGMTAYKAVEHGVQAGQTVII